MSGTPRVLSGIIDSYIGFKGDLKNFGSSVKYNYSLSREEIGTTPLENRVRIPYLKFI